MTVDFLTPAKKCLGTNVGLKLTLFLKTCISFNSLIFHNEFAEEEKTSFCEQQVYKKVRRKPYYSVLMDITANPRWQHFRKKRQRETVNNFTSLSGCCLRFFPEAPILHINCQVK